MEEKIYRIYVEKKQGFDNAARELQKELNAQLNLNIQDVRIFLRYDLAGLDEDELRQSVQTVLSSSPLDNVYYEDFPDLNGYKVFAVEFLPGQYDQRAHNAAQCIQFLTQKQRPKVKCANIYAFSGAAESDIQKIQHYLINPVESRLCGLQKPDSLDSQSDELKPIKTVNGFIDMDKEALSEFHSQYGFAMTVEDLEVVRQFFKAENRDPNEAELKVIDTYWSDHCRHTTFLTQITEIKINSDNPHLQKAYRQYQELFNKHNSGRKDKYQCLMDIVTIAVKELKAQGKLDNLEESEEVNACSIKIKADVDGQEEDWIVMFKNETHNHPTEIEPFGGAATCLGGAIRDPLSGRVYVYQAMRITGAADPTVPIEKTLQGKLPQRTLTRTAAAGYSSYGNQIGLNSGLLKEIFHPNYVAKRMEAGFVVGAAPSSNIVRKSPEPGDIVVLLGGETGRDGIGGATGSSKAHTANIVDVAGAEVQKGNALLERYIQRLYRYPEVTRIIKKCNDFGAGGVSVAIGELAPGLSIYLDRVPLKYPLNPLEIAISESQERMALVLAQKDFDTLKRYADMENLDVTIVAEVNDTNRMTMYYNDQKVIDIDRNLLNTNGARQYAAAEIDDFAKNIFYDREDIDEFLNNNDYKSAVLKKLANLNICSQKGITDMFDSSIGAANLIMPLGGSRQLTPADYMACKLPVREDQNTTTATVASWGYNPNMMSASPFMGAVYSIVLSVMRAVGGGADPDSIKLTCQEYFLRLGKDPRRWGVPTAAVLGALYAQLGLQMGAIGGKDSMSGTFEDIDVPPTLISFALGLTDSKYNISNVLRAPGREIIWLKLKRDAFGMPDFDYINKLIRVIYANIKSGNIDYIQVVENGGAAIAAIKSALSDGLGINFYISSPEIFDNFAGDCLITVNDLSALNGFEYQKLGETVTGDTVINNQKITLDEIICGFTSTLEKVFPTASAPAAEVKCISYQGKDYPKHSKVAFARPRVFIPMILGSNGEYDLERAFRDAGADVVSFVFKNRSPQEIKDSVAQMARLIKDSQILAFPGGFSSADEPGGAGKFAAAIFSDPGLADAVSGLIERDGLIIGLGSGFSALLKLGLLPGGRIYKTTSDSPALAVNNINRHVSAIAKIKICSTKSPWLEGVRVGDIYGVPVSSAEGRFTASQNDLMTMEQNGQIFSQYIDDQGNASAQTPYNPTGSIWAIEGIISPDGRILGKLGQSERCKQGYKNIDLPMDLKIFESGVQYFK